MKMKKQLLFACIILLLGALQVTLVDFFRVFNVKPDFILMMAVIASFIFNFKEAVVLSIFAGVLKDTLGGGPFGLNTLLFPLWSFFIMKLNTQILVDNDLFRIIIMAVITLLHHTLTGLIFVYSGRVVPLGIFLRIVFIETLYTTLVLPWVFKIAERLFVAPQDLSP